MSNLECVDLKFTDCIQFYTKLLLYILNMADVFLVTKHYAIMPNSQASVEKLCLVVSSFRYSP